jgi:prephenate dehydrogenase
MKDVAILGLGLMGGSLGLALKRGQTSITVHGYTRSAERGKCAIDRGALDHFYTNPADAVRHADIVVLCAPILSIPNQLTSIRSALKHGAIVTDVGSTKTELQKKCRELLKGTHAVFIGSHPIAGSEQQGMDAARADLYEKAMVVITPDDTVQSQQVEMVRQLWNMVGATVIGMSPEEHDQVLALTSHVPHITASLLAQTVGRPGIRPDLPLYCGTGYRDTTRIAEGGVDIWMDIIKTNKAPIIQELSVLRQKLEQFIEKLEENGFTDIERALIEGKTSRKAFIDYGHQNNSEE